MRRPTGSFPKITRSPRQSKGPERAEELLRDAQHLIVEAAGLLGSGPEDGGLWDAVAILVEQRESAAAPGQTADAVTEHSGADTL